MIFYSGGQAYNIINRYYVVYIIMCVYIYMYIYMIL